MRGIIYRLGIRIKNAGENSKNIFSGTFIRIGLAVRDFAASIGKK